MEQSSFFNAEKTANGTYDRTYNAEDWAAYFATFAAINLCEVAQH